jgi:hypothetical protein
LPETNQMPILTDMNYSHVLLWLVSLAQITSGAPLPQDAQVFTITLKEGQSERVVNAAVLLDGKFLSEFDMANPPSTQVELHFDTPWTPAAPEKVLSQRIKQIEEEGPIQKDKRYTESGYEQIETPKGTIWIATETKLRAERANELQAALAADLEAKASAHALQVEAGGESPSGPGFVRLWGRHIVILVSALVVLVVAVKSCF